MTKLEMVLDNTLDVSDATIQERFNKFHDKFLKSKKDIEIDVNANEDEDTAKHTRKSKKNIV
ncbi:hypothetical protein LAD12857_43250 [Lacrimispora amygdalina]